MPQFLNLWTKVENNHKVQNNHPWLLRDVYHSFTYLDHGSCERVLKQVGHRQPVRAFQLQTVVRIVISASVYTSRADPSYQCCSPSTSGDSYVIFEHSSLSFLVASGCCFELVPVWRFGRPVL